jgi:glycosyltransferase involved in cell wall biosynthesis
MSESRNVSIILPCYNGEEYLIETLNSVNNQIFEEQIELIFINDGSTDSSLEIFKSFSFKKTITTKLISRENKGFINSIEEGIDCAKYELIARIDADDTWKPNHLSILTPLFANKNIVLVGSRATLIDHIGNHIGESKKIRNAHRYLLKDNPFIHSSIIFRRKDYNKLNNPFRINGSFGDKIKSHYGDYHCFIQFSKVGTLKIINEITLDYRLLGNSMSRSNNKLESMKMRLYLMQKAMETTRNKEYIFFGYLYQTFYKFKIILNS